MNNTVKIELWGMTVGYLTWDKSNWRTETSVFKFDSDFLSKELDISPLRMSIYSPLSVTGLPLRGGRPKDEFRGLPPVFADSLPDHWGNSIFRAWAKEQKMSLRGFTPVDLLSFVGKRAMGALEYMPAIIRDEDDAFDVDVEKLYSFAKEVLEEKSGPEYSSDRELLWQDLVKLGTPPGGKRPKALIAVNPESSVIKSGQAVLPPGWKYYILKYDNESDSFPYARMEYAYYKMCLAAGIEMMHSELRTFSTASHFITERFDRNETGKVHVQSLLAMTGGADSYEDAFDVLRRLKMNYGDYEQLYRRMVFNVIAGNIDDHARNFSFLMDRIGRWSLAPAYDMVYSIDPSVLDVQKGQFLSINGKKNDITEEDLVAVGRRYDINRPGEIIRNTLDVVSRIHDYMRECGVADRVYDMISGELNEKYRSLKGL